MIYREKAATRIDDFGPDGKMLPSAYLKIFENVGDHHSKAVSDNVLEDTMAGVAWILTDWRVEVNRVPDHRDDLTAETWAVAARRLSASTERGIVLRDGGGQALVRASEHLALFDLRQNRLSRMRGDIIEMYQPEDLPVFEDKLPRLAPPASADAEKEIILRRSDIDYNGHVHNTAYFDFALELLPDEELKKKISSFRVSYRRQLKYDDHAAAVRGQKTGNIWNIGIYAGGESAALVEVTFDE